MTLINFPDNPVLNDTHPYGDVVFRFDGTRWTLNGATEFALLENNIWIGDENGRASMVDFLVGYAQVKDELKTYATLVNGNVDLAANGGGNITLAADTAFTFSNFQLNKSYLLTITANGFTPSFTDGTKHLAVEGNAEFDNASTFYVLLICKDSTADAEKLLTTIMKGA